MIRAVLGGSFDPPHDGHVAMIRRVLDDGLAGIVHVIPAAAAPLKDAPTVPAAERLAMTELAFAVLPGVEVDPRELSRPGPSYTIDTMRELAAGYPDDSWLLVVGGDQLDQFTQWRDHRELLELAQLVVLARRGTGTVPPPGLPRGRLRIIRDFDEPVSSTEIRAMLAAGRLPAQGLDPAVAAHIRDRGLYDLV
ncbi:MAG: nicotinate (nicotinamide) nucleotide adenylyltransferase [bacterium]|nr:nicotinate (nicotinamide) nucleotide adenylyltransferase [bacterium]